MLSKTKAIVIHSTKYNDTSSIVTMYTEQFGRTSFLVRGLNNKRSVAKAAFFQPLTLVEVDMLHHPAKDIHTIKDIRITTPLTSINFNPVKNAIALFMSELLFRTIKHSTHDEQLFIFLSQSIEVLDCTDEIPANFHLVFMLKLTRFYGFEPNMTDSNDTFFDLINGEFLNSRPLHAHYLTRELAIDFKKLAKIDYFNMSDLVLSRNQRAQLLKSLTEYFRLHVTGFHGLNSLDVLHRIFD